MGTYYNIYAGAYLVVKEPNDELFWEFFNSNKPLEGFKNHSLCGLNFKEENEFNLFIDNSMDGEGQLFDEEYNFVGLIKFEDLVKEKDRCINEFTDKNRDFILTLLKKHNLSEEDFYIDFGIIVHYT